jgi:hypothetical protein
MVPCLQLKLNEFLNDNKIYSPLEHPCPSVPSLIVMNLKYMLFITEHNVFNCMLT